MDDLNHSHLQESFLIDIPWTFLDLDPGFTCFGFTMLKSFWLFIRPKDFKRFWIWNNLYVIINNGKP